MYGEETLKDRQCRNWFDKFRSGDFSLKDKQRSGRPNEVDDNQIKAIIKSDRHTTVREIEEMLQIPKLTFDCHKQYIGKIYLFINSTKWQRWSYSRGACFIKLHAA